MEREFTVSNIVKFFKKKKTVRTFALLLSINSTKFEKHKSLLAVKLETLVAPEN